MTDDAIVGRLLINASNVVSPGAVILARNLISHLIKHAGETEVTVLTATGSKIIADSVESKVKTLEIKRWRRLNGLQRLDFEFRMLTAIVKDVQPDVILNLGNVAPKDFGVPIVTLLQQPLIASSEFPMPGSISGRVNVYVNRWLFRRTVSRVSALVTQLNFIKDSVLNNYQLGSKKISIIPNGVSEELLKHIQNDKIVSYHVGTQNEIKLLYPSAFYQYKNHRLIISVAEQLKAIASYDVQFLITADGSDRRASKVLETVRAKNLDRFVHNVGMLSEEKLAELYSEATALFFPSLAESFGNPLLEAAAFGLPVLAADLPYAHDVMGDAALYFDPHSPESALDAINQLRDPAVRADLSRKSRKRFEESPSWDDIARMYLEALKGAAASAKK